MIKSNELRIGNYYQQGGKYHQANVGTILELVQYEAAKKCCEINPIPITEKMWIQNR